MAGVINAYSQSGTTFGARVQAAVNAVTSQGGGTVDARDFFDSDTSVSNTITSEIQIPATVRITILIGPVKIDCSASIAFHVGTGGSSIVNDMMVIQGSGHNTIINNTSATGRGVVADASASYAFSLTVRDLRFTKSTAATSGAALDLGGSGTQFIHNVLIQDHYNGIAITGARGNGEVRSIRMDNIANYAIYQDTTGVDHFYAGMLISHTGSGDVANWGGVGFYWRNGNTVYMTDCTFLRWGVGVLVNPGSGQYAQFGFLKGVVADGAADVGIDLRQDGGHADLIVLNDCWASACRHVGLRINLPNRDGIEVVGGKYIGNGQMPDSASWLKFGIGIEAGRIFVGGGALCRDNGSAGVGVAANATNFSIVGIHTGSVVYTQPYGIALTGGGAMDHYIIMSNNLRGNTNAFTAGTPPGSNRIVDHNLT